MATIIARNIPNATLLIVKRVSGLALSTVAIGSDAGVFSKV